MSALDDLDIGLVVLYFLFILGSKKKNLNRILERYIFF